MFDHTRETLFERIWRIKMIKIQIGWKLYSSMETGDCSFYCSQQEIPDSSVTWIRQELGFRIGVADVDDMVIQFYPKRDWAKNLHWDALELFLACGNRCMEDSLRDEFLEILRTKISNALVNFGSRPRLAVRACGA